MSKRSLLLMLFLIALGPCPALSAPAKTQPLRGTDRQRNIDPASVPMPLPSVFMESAMAFGSATAPLHLMAFIELDDLDAVNEWNKIFPTLKTLADRGAVRVYLNDTYENRPGYFAELFLQCIPKERRFELLHLLMNDMPAWNKYDGGATPYYERIALEKKLNVPDIKACMKNMDVRHNVHLRRRQTFLYNGLRFFPTISVINSPYRFVKSINLEKLNDYLQAVTVPATTSVQTR